MNANFAFPPPQPAIPRPPPATKSSSSPPDLAGPRESNVLRASILDTVLELGIGSNSLVAEWMFNNPLKEENEEEEPAPTPALTYGSPASEESVLSPSSSLLHSQSRRDPIINGNGNGVHLNINQNVNKSRPLNFQRRDAGAVGSGRISNADSQDSNVKAHSNPNEATSNVSNFQTIGIDDNVVAPFDISIPPRPTTPSGRKLRKKRAGGDGYESDGGYVSESAKKRDKKKEKKSFIQVINKKSTSNDVQSPTVGYEADGGAVLLSSKSSKMKKSKTKNSPNEIGYETDGRYQSSSGIKSKTRFFRLSTKPSKNDFRVDTTESVPALPNSVKKNEPIVPLPIAERFATTSSPSSMSYSISSMTTLSPSSISTSTFSISSPTTAETGRSGSPLPVLAFQQFSPIPELTTIKMSSLPPVSTGPSTFNRPATAPTSTSSSAFIANTTHLHPNDRDSHSSSVSSSSGSESNQHFKPQKKRSGLFAPLYSPPISMQGHQQHGLRTAQSMSSLRPPNLAISLPITRIASPTPAGLSSSPLPPHSPLPPSVSPSVAPLQINKVQRAKPHLDNLSLTTQQGPGSLMVRPRNSPGPTPTSHSLLPHHSTLGRLRRASQLTIIPSSDYIVPSPQNSPSKGYTPGTSGPNMLGKYYHHDYIPPPSSLPPVGPLPTLPSNGCPEVDGLNGSNGGSRDQYRQRASLMRQSVQQDYGIGLRGKDPVLPSRPVLSPSESTAANGSVSSGGLGQETRIGIHRYRDFYTLENSGVGPSADGKSKQQEETKVAPDRRSWIDIDEVLASDESENLEEEEPEDLYEILDRFESHSNESGDSSPGGQALERTHSFKAIKEQRYHPDSFEARPRQNNKVPTDVVAREICGYEDDGRTVGDRTSRWSGSVYSRASILDEDESEEARDRFVRRVEAMLDVENNMAKNRSQTQAYIPPLPKMPDAYAHKPNGNIREDSGVHSNVPPGWSWNKF